MGKRKKATKPPPKAKAAKLGMSSSFCPFAPRMTLSLWVWQSFNRWHACLAASLNTRPYLVQPGCAWHPRSRIFRHCFWLVRELCLLWLPVPSCFVVLSDISWPCFVILYPVHFVIMSVGLFYLTRVVALAQTLSLLFCWVSRPCSERHVAFFFWLAVVFLGNRYMWSVYWSTAVAWCRWTVFLIAWLQNAN